MLTMEQKSHELALAYLSSKYSNKEVSAKDFFDEYNDLINIFMNETNKSRPKARILDKSKYGF